MLINLTKSAIKEAKRTLDNSENDILRVAISSGGCSGYSYKLSMADFEDNYNEKEDSVLEFDGLRVVVDKKSALYLEGTVLDYISNDLMAGFKFDNPNAVKTCGCGESFQA